MVEFKPMKINRLLDQSHSNLQLSSNSQPNSQTQSQANGNSTLKNLGDSYLLNKNRLYSSIRKLALANGFSYTSELTPDYVALPLSQLDVFLKNKKIPYIDNVSILQEIEKKIPSTTVWDEVTDNLKRNHLFHESCHAVARSESTKIFTKEEKSAHKVLQLMIEESFANACELIAIVDVEDPIHKLFFEINSYIFMYDDRVHLKNLIAVFGFPFALKFLILSYLHANFLYEKLDDKNFERMLKNLVTNKNELEAIKKDGKKIKSLRAIAKIAFELNPRFRLVTSIFYLRLSGFRYQINDLQQLDFMGMIETDAKFNLLIDTLVKKVLSEIKL
jgi:hypothetical protein